MVLFNINFLQLCPVLCGIIHHDLTWLGLVAVMRLTVDRDLVFFSSIAHLEDPVDVFEVKIRPCAVTKLLYVLDAIHLDVTPIYIMFKIKKGFSGLALVGKGLVPLSLEELLLSVDSGELSQEVGGNAFPNFIGEDFWPGASFELHC